MGHAEPYHVVPIARDREKPCQSRAARSRPCRSEIASAYCVYVDAFGVYPTSSKCPLPTDDEHHLRSAGRSVEPKLSSSLPETDPLAAGPRWWRTSCHIFVAAPTRLTSRLLVPCAGTLNTRSNRVFTIHFRDRAARDAFLRQPGVLRDVGAGHDHRRGVRRRMTRDTVVSRPRVTCWTWRPTRLSSSVRRRA